MAAGSGQVIARRFEGFPTPDSAPQLLRAIRKPFGCGPFAAWAVLEYFAVRPVPGEILSACRFREHKGTYIADLGAALATFGLQVEYSGYQEPEHQPDALELKYARTAELRAKDVGVSFRMAYKLRELEQLLDGTRIAVIQYNTERTEIHAHTSPLVAVRDGQALLPFEAYSPLPLDVLEFYRGYHGIQRECLLVSKL